MQTSTHFAPESAVSTTDFSPMPLRARGVLENLDLTIKVFRRYAGVLLAWSALIIGVCGVVALMGAAAAGKSFYEATNSGASFGDPGGLGVAAVTSLMFSTLGASALGFFCYPLMIGASACCVAGAVRGQNVKFTQCWSFSRPRYGSMLGQILVAFIVLWIAIFAFAIGIGIVVALGAWLVSQLPGMVAVPIGIVALIVLYAAFFVAFMLATMWLVLVPVVVCMEENNRNANAMGRALSLLRGNWRRASGLMLLVWLGALVVGVIARAPMTLLLGDGRPNFLMLGLVFLGQMLVWLATFPLYTLLVTLFYLDARVRNEALDLEWTSHSGTTPNANATDRNAANANSDSSRDFYPRGLAAEANVVQPNVIQPNAWNNSTIETALPTSFAPQNAVPNNEIAATEFAPPNAFAVENQSSSQSQNASAETVSLNENSSFAQTDFPVAAPNNFNPAAAQLTPDIQRPAAIQNSNATVPNATVPQFPTPTASTSTPRFETQVSIPAAPSEFSIASSTRWRDETTTETTFAETMKSAPSVAPTALPNRESDNAPAISVEAVACPQCGADVPAAQTFCMTCGARVKASATGFGE